jgi:hypothetical protein
MWLDGTITAGSQSPAPRLHCGCLLQRKSAVAVQARCNLRNKSRGGMNQTVSQDARMSGAACTSAYGAICGVSSHRRTGAGCVEDVQRHHHPDSCAACTMPKSDEVLQKTAKKQDSTAGCKRSNGDAPRAHAAVARRRRSVRGSGHA